MSKDEFWVNGLKQIISPGDKTNLLTFLRDNLKLTGTKKGCDDGSCGACTVLVDNQPKRACQLDVSQVIGCQVETIEGIGNSVAGRSLQHAFVESGAVQCGFCIPGMINRAEALLRYKANPAREEIIRALKPHLCRCGNYPRVVTAVKEAARIRNCACSTAAPRKEPGGDYVGQSIIRADAWDKATGRCKYVSDMSLPGMLYGRMLLSSHAHALLRRVDVSRAEQAPGVKVVLTADRIPGKNRFGVLVRDQPVLAEKKVRYRGEVIAVVFAESEAGAEQAVSLIEVDYQPLPGVYRVEEALAEEAPHIHDGGNLLREGCLKRGDIKKAFREAAVIVSGTYTTPMIEHGYLETEAALARPMKDGGVEILVGTQAPFANRDQLAEILALPLEQVRVIHSQVGGAFGGKLELSAHPFVALGALMTQRPCKMVYTREESLRTHGKRHAYTMEYRTAAAADGKLMGMQIKILADGGAYSSWSPRVFDQSLAFGTGPYYVPHLDVTGKVVFTNNFVAGAMRGFGALQVHFAVESQMDILAEKLKLDPLALRERNALEKGRRTASGQILTGGVELKQTIRQASKAYFTLLREKEEKNKNLEDSKFGVGVACAWWCTSGGLGLRDRVGARVELLPGGRARLSVACIDMGQGSITALVQIAAQTLGVNPMKIEMITGDTGLVPAGGAIYSSRAVYAYGHSVLAACKRLRRLILAQAAVIMGIDSDELVINDGVVYRVDRSASLDLGILYDRCKGEGLSAEEAVSVPETFELRADTNECAAVDPAKFMTHHTLSFATQIAMVKVEQKTGRVKVSKVISIHDSGRIINPELAKSQVEGGIIMGTGYALFENFKVEAGINLVDKLGKCRMPRIDAAPEEIEIIFLDLEDPTGPLGAKGIAEIGTIPIAPAIINAIHDATGIRVYSLPAIREKISPNSGGFN